MSRQNQKRRDPAELLKSFKRLYPMKGSGIESVTILKRGPDGFEALGTLTEESERRMNNQEDIHEHIAQLLRLIPVCPAVVASVLHGCFRQISGEGCLADYKLHQSDEAAEGQLIKTAICRNERSE